MSEDVNKYIILQDFKENNPLNYTNLYDKNNKFMDYYMNGVYEFFYGNSKQSDELFMNCLRLLHCEDIVKDDDEKIELYLADFKKSISLLNSSILEWENTVKSNISNFINMSGTLFKKPYDFKMKKYIKGLTYYKENFIKDSFSNSRVFKSTIHSVKGKTYESVLLFTKERKEINGKTLIAIKPNESTRMAFVAMTRAQKLLCVAVDVKLDYTSAFPPTIWDYLELKKEDR